MGIFMNQSNVRYIETNRGRGGGRSVAKGYCMTRRIMLYRGLMIIYIDYISSCLLKSCPICKDSSPDQSDKKFSMPLRICV